MKTNPAALIAAGLALSACTTSGGNTIQSLAPELQRSARVDEVVMVRGPSQGVSGEFQTVFQTKVREQLAKCATGATPLRAEVTVIEFKRANPAMTWLIADNNRIVGQVKLVNAADGYPAGEYNITRGFGATGLIGIAMMAEAEEQMSSAFGDELCKRAFGGKN